MQQMALIVNLVLDYTQLKNVVIKCCISLSNLSSTSKVYWKWPQYWVYT